MKIVFLAGAPGSGKSTQGAELMQLNRVFKHLSLGEVVRDILKNPQHIITQKYKELINSGSLLPDNVILEILVSELDNIKDQNVVVLLDGYPRTVEQYEQFKEKWGRPEGLVHLDVDEHTLNQRLQDRNTSREDDHKAAIRKRLDFYKTITQPLLDTIKQDLTRAAITVNTVESVKTTGLYLYTRLHRITGIHEELNRNPLRVNTTATNDPTVKVVGSTSIISKLWNTWDGYKAIDTLQKCNTTQNFSFSMFGKKMVYLETPNEVKAILEAKTRFGIVYQHFSMAAGLKHDFVATNSNVPEGKINIWSLIHKTLGEAFKDRTVRIASLMNKHLNQTFFAKKAFDLDTTFDLFFCSFWSEYLFGDCVGAFRYMENRERILSVMKQCFYTNNYKALDPTCLSSMFYSLLVRNELNQVKVNIKQFIREATPASLVQRFKMGLIKQNQSEHSDRQLGADAIDAIVEDNVFDLIFEPDFLENVMYEGLVAAIKDNVDLHNKESREQVYALGLQNGYLFPLRSRILEEPITLNDGTHLPVGSLVYINLKKARLFHSAGPRRCVGQTFTYDFRNHFFDRMQSIDFKVKQISLPEERVRKAGNPNVPMSPERYHVSWRLKRDEAMRILPFHNYKGKKFFDVLSFHQNPELDAIMVQQCVLKINRFLQKNVIGRQDIVIVTPEVRGIAMAAKVAQALDVPLYIIRKKGGNKMAPDEVYMETYSKGYGDPDTVEMPKADVHKVSGKQIIFIDDGIASGKSAAACINLLEQHHEPGVKPAHVPMIFTILKHDYTQIDPDLLEHRVIKTLFDCHGGEFTLPFYSPSL